MTDLGKLEFWRNEAEATGVFAAQYNSTVLQYPFRMAGRPAFTHPTGAKDPGEALATAKHHWAETQEMEAAFTLESLRNHEPQFAFQRRGAIASNIELQNGLVFGMSELPRHIFTTTDEMHRREIPPQPVLFAPDRTFFSYPGLPFRYSDH